jgi:hypothetical protein
MAMRMHFELLSFSVICINNNFVMPSVFETVFVVRLASKRDSDY